MTDYDFKQLNDKEFEILGTDVLGRRENVTFERFKPGRDSGVDGRYFRPDSREEILQCKHWPASPLEKLVNHLEKVELPKANKLNPAKYYLILSHALSRSDKSRIASIMAPHIKSPSDILGKEDLNDLISKHPDIEIRHYKLWICSSAVLQHLINKPIYDRSAFAIEEILADAKKYVITKSHDQALEILERLGVVIISGAAGIGKTTLADHLAINYITKGFSFIQIAQEIHEAESVFDNEKKQLFYFDDFLGRNYLEALSGHEGSHIVRFIKRVSKDRKKRFILTSRSTILNQGKILIDVFQNNNLNKNEFELVIDSFTEMDKAKILYNHIWHGFLEPEFIDQIYERKRYREIIFHKNYNPRLIKYITDMDHLGDRQPPEYWNYIKELLDNPKRVWENPFEAQLDDFGRAIVLLVTLNGHAISQLVLGEAYARYIAPPGAESLHGKRDFLLNARHLSGSFLSRSITKKDKVVFNLFNPSIGDFVLHRYSSDIPSLKVGFASLRSDDSLRTLENLAKNKLITLPSLEDVAIDILEMARDISFLGYAPGYISIACLILIRANNRSVLGNELINAAFSFVSAEDCPICFNEVAEFYIYALTENIVDESKVVLFVEQACKIKPVSKEIDTLSRLVQSLSEEQNRKISPIVEDVTVTYLSEEVYSEFSDEDVFAEIDPGDSDAAYSKLFSLVESKFESFGISASSLSVGLVVDSFDISARMSEYYRPYDYEPSGSSNSNFGSINEIDDLFDRCS